MPPKHPIVWSPRKLRWYLNGYPPLFWHRAKLLEVDPDMRWAKVRLKRSLWNRNLNGSAFGGAIYTAADPWFPILYWQALAREGIAVQGWLKAATVDYKKPARSHLTFVARNRIWSRRAIACSALATRCIPTPPRRSTPRATSVPRSTASVT